MKQFLHGLAFVAVLLAFVFGATSCSEKKSALRDLERLASYVEKNGDSFGVSEWMDVFTQYREIDNVITKHKMDYSYRQKARINEAKMTIRKEAKKGIMNTLNIFPGVKKALQETFDGIFGGESNDEENIDDDEDE